jgi:hypothetical protein
MITEIYSKVASKTKVVPANKVIDIIKNEEYVYDPEKALEKELVIEEMNEHLEYVHADRGLQLTKWGYFVFAITCLLVGLTLTLWGLRQTILFDKFNVNMTMFYCSFVLYLPCFMFMKYICFPSFDEYQQRQEIIEKRHWRNRVKELQFFRYMGWKDTENDENVTDEQREKARIEAARKKYKLKVGKNVLKLGEGVKPHPDNFGKKSITTIANANRGLNIVVDRKGFEFVRPPAIIPDQVLATGTAHLLPGFTENNKHNIYKFVHPDVEGEELGRHLRKTVKRSEPVVTFGVPK